LLNLFAGSETVAPAFLGEGVVGKAAYAVVRFLETLLNEKGEAVCATLGADAKKKYGFDRDALVLAICEFAVRVDAAGRSDDAKKHQQFARALARESDYDAATMERARASLIEKTFGPALVPPLLRDLIDRAETEKRAFRAFSKTFSEENAGNGGKTRSSSIRDDDAFDPDALLAALGPDAFAGDESREADAYKAAFSDGSRTFGETDDGAGLLVAAGDGSPCDFFPPFAALARENASVGDASSGSQKKAKKLAKEAAAMASGALPLELGSSIFFRHDPDRLDVARVVIVGPANTPYEGGAFAFDAFCPAGYPDQPPMVNLDTTGGGRARFNPNLYADGKVCLSLLGTWHGGAAEEKWDARRSTLAQVFVSIQGLIFVDDPMFNEPGFDGLRGLKEGDEKSARYNAEIRLFTIRHAMIDALKKPRRGIGDTVRTHFSIRRWSVMRRVLRWCEDAEKADPVIRRRTREAAVELSRLLARLE
jgi:ubiquitin-protein ligase